MSKNREKKHAAHLAERKAHAQQTLESTAEQHEAHLVEAPKGTSRARFLFNLLLVIFLLLIFSITGPMMSSLTGGGAATGEVAMRWTTPDGERREVETGDFYDQKRRIRTLEPFFQFLLLGQVDPGDDIQVARFLILESLARRSGIHVADEEVAETILAFFETAENYNSFVASRRELTQKAFEEILRRGLIVRRFLQMSGLPAGEVLAEDVIERWKSGAQEYNFEFVEVVSEDYEDAARAELPGAEELEDWFNALPAFQKQEFNTERSFAADIAWFDPEAEGDYAQLLERFPRPEEEDAEVMAENYYNRNSHVRFARPIPANEDEAQKLEESGDKFFTFEEVKEQVQREAPIYYSMMDWISDLRLRQSQGENPDLETEAISLGLNFVRLEPRTLTALREGEEPWSGNYLAGSLMRVQEGEFSRRVEVEEGALVVGKVIEILPPSLPPFPEIQDRVADKWVKERRPAIAAERLEAVRDAFGERPEEEGAAFETSATSEEFAAAATAAGFEVQERGWSTQYPRLGEVQEQPTQFEFYLRSKASLYSADDGHVAAAEATRDGNAAYLVRCAGEREADVSTMRPVEVDSNLSQLRQAAAQKFFTSTYADDNWLRSTFNLYLRSLDEEVAEGQG